MPRITPKPTSKTAGEEKHKIPATTDTILDSSRKKTRRKSAREGPHNTSKKKQGIEGDVTDFGERESMRMFLKTGSIQKKKDPDPDLAGGTEDTV